MKYDEQVLGVLVLYHCDSYHFTQERIAAALTLIRYAQPYLHQARAHSARDAWDSMIMHTLRTSLPIFVPKLTMYLSRLQIL